MPKQKNIRDGQLLAVAAQVSAWEARMISPERLARMISGGDFREAARIASECGYPDMSDMDAFRIDEALSARRAQIFLELGESEAAPLLDIFRLKYDYHNVKCLVKAYGADEDAARIMSHSGRVAPEKMAEAFLLRDTAELPGLLGTALSDGLEILSSTGNPQLADASADRFQFREMLALCAQSGVAVLPGYTRLMIDVANLRTIVRARRVLDAYSLVPELIIPGGNADTASVLSLLNAPSAAAQIFSAPELQPAALLAESAMSGGGLTAFELALGGAVYSYIEPYRYVAFGAAAVIWYLIALDWELTALRVALIGLRAGVPAHTLEERTKR
ncbi:MAG: V-type ATPase subunit [Oscillospiraceae bacterium]|nr:V-type ATPase subunit [Oscillospiraceae bacterium]